MTLAADGVRALTDLPAFPTSTVDGWAVRGPAPWRIGTQVLAGTVAAPLGADGICVEIATGAMVPAGTEAILRVEDSTMDDGLVTRHAARRSASGASPATRPIAATCCCRPARR